MERTLREQWKIWVKIRDSLCNTYGELDTEFGVCLVGKENPMYDYYIQRAKENWVVPSEIIKKNLISCGHATNEGMLVGYRYDWDFPVPCNRLI